MLQRSEQWHQWRKGKIGSSHAATILGVNTYQTPFQLWEILTGRKPEPATTPAMARGIELEPQARAAYEAELGYPIAPTTRTHPQYGWMIASMDGLSFDGLLVVEIKAPMPAAYNALRADEKIPPYYYAQVMHQLAVTGASEAHLWIFDPEKGGFLRVLQPDLPFMLRLIEAERLFMEYVQRDVPPPQTERDVQVRDDAPFLTAAAAFIEAETRLTETRALYDGARQALLALCNGGTVEGGGVRVTTFERQGNVDYAKVPQLKGVDLNPYRRASIREHRVTVKK